MAKHSLAGSEFPERKGFLQGRDPDLKKKQEVLLAAKWKYFSAMERNALSEEKMQKLKDEYQKHCTEYLDLFILKLKAEKSAR